MSDPYRVMAEGLAFPEGPIPCTDGSVLISEMAAGCLTRVRPDGSTQPFAYTGGGPNGIGRLPDGRLVVCQNGGSRFGIGPWPYDFDGCARLFRPIGAADDPVTPSLQLVDTTGDVTTLATEFVTRGGQRQPLIRPSDICVDSQGGFYVTDAGTVSGRTRSITGLLYGTVDGGLREVVYPLEMPNGTALSPDESKVYVAETRTRRVWEFGIAEPGSICSARGLATVPSGGRLNIGGADGLCVDEAGRILVATLGAGGITVFSPEGDLLGGMSADDPMTTNVTLSNDGRSLYVTLASTGRLVVVEDWLKAADLRRGGVP